MSITAIEAETLRHMKGKEGLIIQGCGGDLDEWVKGINDELTKEGILLDGTRIEDCKRFTNGELTCLLFPFDGAKLDTGKLAILVTSVIAMVLGLVSMAFACKKQINHKIIKDNENS